MKWKLVKVGDVAKQVRGVSYKPADVSETLDEECLPILRANNITDAGLIFSDFVYVNKRAISKQQMLKSGDIVIAASSGSKSIVGKAGYFEGGYEVSFGAFCKVIRPSENILPKYLSYYFTSDNYRKIISNLSEGANINNLRTEHLDNLVLPLPPLSTQQKIAAILDEADALRRKDKALLAKYDELLQAVFYEMFGDPERNEKGWSLEKVENIIKDGPQNGLYKHSNDYGDGVPILRIDSFYDGVVHNIDKLKRVGATEDEIKLFQIYENNIVINRVNSRSHLGKCALIPQLFEPTVFESNMMKVEVDDQRVNPRYFSQIFSHPFVKRQVLGRAKDAVNQSSINQQDVKSFVIPLPPIKLQNDFVKIAVAIEHQKSLIIQQQTQSENLFQSLMQRAFKGELV